MKDTKASLKHKIFELKDKPAADLKSLIEINISKINSL